MNLIKIDIQLCEKIMPAFEQVHSAGYQALFLVDNSQGIMHMPQMHCLFHA